jgi:hypothetical protein
VRTIKTRKSLLTVVTVGLLALGISAFTVAGAQAQTSAAHGKAAELRMVRLMNERLAAADVHVPGYRSNSDETTFTIPNYLAPTRCLGIANGGTTDGTDAVLYGCNGSGNQSWTFIPSCIGTFCQMTNSSGKCLGVSGGSTSPNANLVLWGCISSHDDQYWSVENLSPPAPCSDALVFQNLNSLKVAGTAGGSTDPNTDIVQYGYQDSCNNQIWF